jgi:dTDP-glucose 4,6-dehydratase
MSKTYLVTGGAGFIGSNFIHYLLKKHQDILVVNVDKLTYAGNLENLKSVMDDKRHVFVQADICDTGAMQRLFQEYTIDYVVNFAAESHVDRSITDPDVFVRTNVMGTLNLLNIAKAAWKTGEDTYREGVKFQQVSTDEVYGSLGPEGFFTETTPLDPHSPYSASKTSADLFVKAYADTYRLPVTITRCSNNYGPYQFPEKLIPLMINNCLNKKSLPVYGDGMQIRDWLYVEDHCKAIDLVLQKGRAGEVYNVGGHNEQPNIAIVKSIIAYVSEKVDPGINESLIKHVTDRKGHDRRYGIDPTKIKEELGWEPETMFSEGIKKTIDWYLENRQWMEHVTSGSYQHYYQEMYANR